MQQMQPHRRWGFTAIQTACQALGGAQRAPGHFAFRMRGQALAQSLIQVCLWASSGFYLPFIIQMVPACLPYPVNTQISLVGSRLGKQISHVTLAVHKLPQSHIPGLLLAAVYFSSTDGFIKAFSLFAKTSKWQLDIHLRCKSGYAGGIK